MSSFSPPENSKESKFHGAFMYLERLDRIFQGLDSVTLAREHGTVDDRIGLWRKNLSLLRTLFKELYPKMTDEEKKKNASYAVATKKQYENALRNTRRRDDGKVDIDLGFVWVFDEWELELRNIAESRGLIMPDKKTMESAVDL